MLQKLFILAGITALSTLLIFEIYLRSQPDSKVLNGFNRRFKGSRLRLVSTLDLATNNFNFAGTYNGSIYLRDVDHPDQLVEINGNDQNTIAINNPLKGDIKAGELAIYPPDFFLADLYNYRIYKGDVARWTVHQIVREKKFFSEFQPVSGSSIVLRDFNNDKTKYQLSKSGTHGDTFNAGLLEKQIDGLFCTDGMLRYDSQSKRIVYTYFYRNQFIVTDTSLNLISRVNTIDTTRKARISIARNESAHYSSLSSPPFIVNRASACYDGKLYINSNLKADNEELHDYNSSDVIDVYSEQEGNYLSSFRISKINKTRLRHFAIFGTKLYVLRSHHLEVYDFVKDEKNE